MFLGGDVGINYREWYKFLVWFWIFVGFVYFVVVFSMIGDWLRVFFKKIKEEVGFFLDFVNVFEIKLVRVKNFLFLFYGLAYCLLNGGFVKFFCFELLFKS